MRVTKAIVPAAGLGTRFLPSTKALPKEMLNIVDKPAMHYIVEEAVLSGAKDILIIVNDGKDCINNYFSKHSIYDKLKDRNNLEGLDELIKKANFHYITQTKLNGNGAAVLLAKDFAKGEPVSVLFGDDIVYSPNNPVTKQLIQAFNAVGGKAIVGCQERPLDEAVNYGVIKCGKQMGKLVEMLDIVEKPSINELPSNLCSLGRFVLPFSIFEELENAPLFRNEIYLTTALKSLTTKYGAYAYNFEGQRYDIGDKFGFLQANLEYALRSEFSDKVKDLVKELALKI